MIEECLEPIGEVEVQIALATLLRESTEFADCWLRAIGAAYWCREVVESVEQSVHGSNGESDLVAIWRKGSHEVLASYIEVKVDAAFMKRQGQRYIERANARHESDNNLSSRIALVAPRAYLLTANPEARHFPEKIAFEDLLTWVTPDLLPSNNCRSAHAKIADTLDRLRRGAPLGAKGLHVALYQAVADECDRRGNELTIINRPTDWMSLKHECLPVGVSINYRIQSSEAELRVLKSYAGNRDMLVRRSAHSPVTPVNRNTELFLRLPALEITVDTTRGAPAIADVERIVDSFEALIRWWSSPSQAH